MNNNLADQQKPNYTLPIIIIASLFFIFGFVTWINSVLIPFMKSISELTNAQAYLVATASYISFAVMALPASYIISKLGYRRSMSVGLIVMAAGALVFIPGAETRTYWVFLSAIFIQGAGMAILQTAANPYITILGPIKSGAKRIAIMGICNKVAGVVGSIVFGALLLNGIDQVDQKIQSVSAAEKDILLHDAASKVVAPYIVMAIILALLGLLINRAPLPTISEEQQEDTSQTDKTHKTSIFQFPHFWIGAIALFLYVGVEVTAADTIIAYGKNLGFSSENAKFFTTFTLVAMIGTYLLGALLIPKYISQEKVLVISAVLGVIFTIGIISTKGFTSVLFVAFSGIANALVWPAIWPITLKGMGKTIKTASAILVMAIAGGAIIPPIYGLLVDSSKMRLIQKGIEEQEALSVASTTSYWILIPCYLVILFYALKGHKIGKRN